MKVIVTGATGNVGTSTVAALSRSSEIDEIVGLARRKPTWSPPKTSWVEANVLNADLEKTFAGADAVIHLAWAIQPSRDATTLERINVEGSRRVFEAVASAGVPKLVHASSVGAYSRGPKDREVDESWPVEATASSFYSRHKVAVEKQLDRFEAESPDTRVVRLRPALIFKGEAATEIRRLFIGPFLPSFLLRSGLLPALPRIDRLRLQAVHSEDVGQAYLRAVLADARGAFNLAAEPPLSPEEMAERIGVRSFPVPAGVVRRLADLSWRLRLQPTPPGWLDMALNVPLMSSKRAREELGWEPRHSAVAALEELLEALREGRGGETPPLKGDSAGARLDDLKTGVGARQWSRDRDEQLVKYLADAHSIEQQALAQLRAAPEIAGDERLAEPFERHLAETEVQERRVRERLEALGGTPSKLKDAAGVAGGWGMAAFAASQPDTPGKLAMHAYSYEHMELAAYELLRRLAERSGDQATARIAAEIAAELLRRRGRGVDRVGGQRAPRRPGRRLPARRPRPGGAGDRPAGGGRQAGRGRRARARLPRAPRADPPSPRDGRGAARGAGRRRLPPQGRGAQGGRPQSLRLLRRPARLDHEARRLRLRLRAPRGGGLRAAEAGRRARRRRAGGRGRRADPRRGAPGGRARRQELGPPRRAARAGLLNQDERNRR
jgi:UDP-glucose 4-epimerase